MLKFTPNSDQHNEIFSPQIKNVKEFEIDIYDRWGALIYKSSDELEWNGKNASDGIYYWQLKYKGYNIDKWQELKGWVQLLK